MLTVPNSDCSALLSIRGARKRRNVVQSGVAADMDLPFIRTCEAVAARGAAWAVDRVEGKRRAVYARSL
ncbi:hypothetical protein F07S3_06190 [Bradyrhizobium diazoefficiens]|uniref:Uncharacterized protein n=1 Tax=Bradyrhizobium diazoefficiens TaxID=1355477 RepID=A0A810BUX0_9BRAD|nr:hypothetical protein F07S3_06190 [Bradyrhizobium diazoefficiens]BBZ99700.1 hypothetical protein H12S4_06050 [Bradyrhizobium diazoefficiens]BCA08772.1 hypothetical protein BDHF08_06190 [Bradyrhizobium diazoefficiens]BCA17387.1 hypothetical protein BDHH15_06020 [Bradyrhizobium diazoefficiens]BCE18003.1 hypothetical protein XF1B_06840 [Bradyrhizobium diazoefficiens]